MISFSADSHKQAIINNWKTAFPNDSEAFVNFYFEKKYENENTLLYFKDDEIVSCLQMLPYKMTYYKRDIKTSYISGATTLPTYQNQGLMRELLVHAFKEMWKRGDVLTTLIPQTPQLIDFYKKFGYTPCFEYEIKAICPDEHTNFPDKMQFRPIKPADLRPTYLCYRKMLINRNVCIQKNIIDFAIMVQACQNFGGEVYIVMDKGEVCAGAFCFFTDGKLILKDFSARNTYYRQYFLSKLMEKYDHLPMFTYLPVNEFSKPELLGMARIVNAEKLLTQFARANPNTEFSIKIEDKDIFENNIILAIADGEIVPCRSTAIDFEVSIDKLTQLLLGYRTHLLGKKYACFPQQHPYMSLMLE